MAASNKSSFARPPPSRKATNRNRDSEDDSKGIWTSLLESVSGGKKLAEKTLLILGGNIQSQNEFLEMMAQGPAAPQRRLPRDRSQRKKPPIANRYALGYTYQDVVGADQDDILARLSIYMLADTRPAYATLLQPLFTPKTIPDMMVVILLDWEEPWTWIVQVLNWIKTLRWVLDDADNSCIAAIQENTKAWRERKKGLAAEDAPNKPAHTTAAFPLGPGEWDEALGVPLCVVCQHAEKVDNLEANYGWRDKEFDTVMQFLRTILLKHGGSLIYTASSDPGSLQSLIRSSLDIHSLLQKNNLKRNVTDRDKVLIPPMWDSWGNIRAQSEDFPVEEVSNAWSADVDTKARRFEITDSAPGSEEGSKATESKTITMYEQSIKSSARRHVHASPVVSSTKSKEPLIQCPDYQGFLSKQAERLEGYRVRDETEKQARIARGTIRVAPAYLKKGAEFGSVSDHLGPVQFNMGGISVDAEAAIEALQAREARRGPDGGSLPDVPDERTDDEKRLAFFAALKVEGRGGSTS